MLKRANEHEDEWKEKLETYTEKYPELAEEFKLAISGKLPKIIKMNYQNSVVIIMQLLVQILEKSFKQLVNLFLHSLVVLQI